ncbi:DUF4148 domain-containing protein [Paraburkholderia caribensis]|uniref:DUF4148 domain-containing protein n=1 Tax=Paraburkholderia caribensis TaxID=75105 RepID=A0A9Q6S7W3_9BURK|nr:DUF4148 domain-containing protein [Paraburkholderia caribensis]MCO4879125.1 DUF4148 domain-containing protein [Paraburkholderia caribensis]PTB28100.1 hypothetical protein C9I56_14730 [Paraburkholderia caribensis]QLB66249.1 hypothetical protein A9O66_28805 [Paraburkholderia caribensis]
MKRVYQALVLAAALGLPLASLAETQPAATRAQVRAELIAAQQAGQYPQSDTRYPEPANDPAAAPHVFHRSHDLIATSYGPSASGSAGSGFRAARAHSLAGASSAFDDIYRGQ